MTPGMTLHYLGALRCEGKHLRSGNTLITDAPPDNNGKGEAFSPTDLMCTSLASCMVTIMHISAKQKGIQLGGIKADIEKVMASDPRRVTAIHINMTIEETGLNDKERESLERAAINCPVAKSLHPEIVQRVEFKYV